MSCGKYIRTKQMRKFLSKKFKSQHHSPKTEFKKGQMSKTKHLQWIKGITKKFLIQEYIKNRKTTRQIAKELNCSSGVIRLRLKYYNISIRKSSEKSLAFREKMRGKKHTKKTKEKIRQRRLGSKALQKTKKKMSLSHGGTGIPHENDKYPKEFYEIREQIRQKDKYTCQVCSIQQENYYRKLDVHHIDYDKNNFNLNNLISLCQSCHIKTNFNRDYWKNYCKEKINGNI